MKCIIDGRRIKNKRMLHTLLKEELKLSEYYGKNLDALWDEISSSLRPREIVVKNKDQLLESLGDYGERFLETLYDLDKEVYNFTATFLEGDDRDGSY